MKIGRFDLFLHGVLFAGAKSVLPGGFLSYSVQMRRELVF
jgi:hypothetical protein